MEDGSIIRLHLDHIKPYLEADRNSEYIERQDDSYYPISDPVPIITEQLTPVQAPDIRVAVGIKFQFPFP